jgi:hypothetical protein
MHEHAAPSGKGRRLPENPGEGVGALQGRDDPFETAERLEGVHRLVVRGGGVPGASRGGEPAVLRSHAGIVESRREGVGGKNLAVRVLEDEGVGSVEDSRRSRREGRRVQPRVHSSSCGFHSHERHRGIVEKGGEDPMALLPPPKQATTRSGTTFPLPLQDIAGALRRR